VHSKPPDFSQLDWPMETLQAAPKLSSVAGRLAELARELPIELSAAQCETLEQYARLLLRWNRVHNLTAITQDDEVLTHHLLDSLSIVDEVRTLCAGRPSPRILDVGSGAGLPGIPLAVALPSFQFVLNDSVGKKCTFMTQAKLQLALPRVQVIHCRVEQLLGMQFDLIVSRAVGTLADLSMITRHLLAPGGHWLAMKGRIPEEELRELPAHARALKTVTLRVPQLDEARSLVVLGAV
jgi:16S rRNA (guanine527-N7)-methyltransferase